MSLIYHSNTKMNILLLCFSVFLISISARHSSKGKLQDGPSNNLGSNPADLPPDKFIAGGVQAEIGQFPWMVHLNILNGPDGTACGGSLISNTHILTAAHCVASGAQRIQVFLSEHDQSSFGRDCYNGKCIQNQMIYAAHYVIHPGYNRKNLDNDIAILKLSRPVAFSESIQVISIPSFTIDSPSSLDAPVYVAGWGKSGPFSQQSNVLQYTTLKYLPRIQCREYDRGLTQGQICAIGYEGQDSCPGDSGGPLMAYVDGKYYVSGIVSGSRSGKPCGTPGMPGFYTDVYTYSEWIRNNMQ